MSLFETAVNLKSDAAMLKRRRYGVIEVADGRLQCVRLRPWPKIASAPGALLDGWLRRWRHGDRVRLYYNQPWRFESFLALTYVVSTRGASLRSLRTALETLDEIARIKRSDALLCDAANWRISRRLLARLGWVPHCPSRWRRHYIKRFYGDYPPRPAWIDRAAATVPTLDLVESR